MGRGGLAILWSSFILYAFLLAPPDQPGTTDLILNLASGHWQGINPLTVALFNIMGIWPMVYACVTLIDGHNQQARAWPFVVASFAVGAFSILPYLIWRSPNPTFKGPKNWLLGVMDSRWLGLLLLLGGLTLMGYGLLAGDWGEFFEQWRTNRFIHVMSLDFCLLWLLFPALLGDDMARRGLKSSVLFFAIATVPLIGAAAYLTLRPPLPAESSEPSLT